MKKQCSKCAKPSLTGLVPSVALCQFHYDAHMWGEPWAKWVHGYARCCDCGRALKEHEGIYRNVPRCTACDESYTATQAT